MKKELQEALFEKYPKIFSQRNLSMKETCMCWGFECGDGWYCLIDELCEYLQFHIDHNKHPQVEAVQVKEKFGGLCFYTHTADTFLSWAIRFTECLSLRVCEACGSIDDVTQTTGWIRTLCRKCLELESPKGNGNNENSLHD